MVHHPPSAASPFPYLGEGCSSPYPFNENLQRWIWKCVEATLFRWSPEPLHGWRAWLLRVFGANIPEPGNVVVFPTVRTLFPWKLELAERAMIGPGVILYNPAPIVFGYGANISQNVHFCSGTHDYNRWEMPLVARPIRVEANVWIAADAFVGPGVTIGELCVVGARSVVVRDLPPRSVCAGNPCRVIKPREEPS